MSDEKKTSETKSESAKSDDSKAGSSSTTEPTFADWKRVLEELIAMATGNLTYGSHRAVYLQLDGGKAVPRVVEIGQMIHEMGGMEFMQASAEFVKTELRKTPQWDKIRSDMRELEYAWDNIGKWRA